MSCPPQPPLHMASPHAKSRRQGVAASLHEQKGGCAHKEKFIELCAQGKMRSRVRGKREGAKREEGKSRAYSAIPPARTRSIPAARQLREGEGNRGEKGREREERREEKMAAAAPGNQQQVCLIQPLPPLPLRRFTAPTATPQPPPICASDLCSVSLWCPTSTRQSVPAID